MHKVNTNATNDTAKKHPTLSTEASDILEELGVHVVEQRWGWLLLDDDMTRWAASVEVMEAAAEAVADASQYEDNFVACPSADDQRYEAFLDAMGRAGYDRGLWDDIDTMAGLYAAAHGMTDGQTWGTADLPGDADSTERVWIGESPEEATPATLCRWEWDDDDEGTGILIYGDVWDIVTRWDCEAGEIWDEDPSQPHGQG